MKASTANQVSRVILMGNNGFLGALASKYGGDTTLSEVINKLEEEKKDERRSTKQRTKSTHSAD